VEEAGLPGFARNLEDTVRMWCERSEIDALFEAGWLLADAAL